MNFGDRCPWCGHIMDHSQAIIVTVHGDMMHARCEDVRNAQIRRDRTRADAPPRQATGIGAQPLTYPSEAKPGATAQPAGQ